MIILSFEIREFLCEIVTKIETISWGEYRAYGISIHDKNRDLKSHATVLLNTYYRSMSNCKLQDFIISVGFYAFSAGLQLRYPGLQLKYPGLWLKYPGLQLKYPRFHLAYNGVTASLQGVPVHNRSTIKMVTIRIRLNDCGVTTGFEHDQSWI